MLDVELYLEKRIHTFPSAALPPVGTVIEVHKHLTEDGTYGSFEVTKHEWNLEEPPWEEGPDGTSEEAPGRFTVRVRTRRLPQK